MAQISVRNTAKLDAGWVLTPERYDPRLHAAAHDDADVVELSAIASFHRQLVSPGVGATGVVDEVGGDEVAGTGTCAVFDTSDARDGYLTIGSRPPVARTALGSPKKLIRPGDVILSRLRPYLRQVAWLDSAIENQRSTCPVTPVASMEFYVLRSTNHQSIAFLVPFLLSAPVQQILAASQEGGHHPRVPQSTIARLLIPRAILAHREALSAQVESAITATRTAARQLAAAVNEIDRLVVVQFEFPQALTASPNPVNCRHGKQERSET